MHQNDPLTSPTPKVLEETSIDELISAWQSHFGLPYEECKARVNQILHSLLSILQQGVRPFFLPINNERAIMVEKKSKTALGLTKIQFTPV